MQLMPYTAKLVAKQAKLPYSKSRLTTDPEYNINLGSHYIAGLILEYDGAYPFAIAAYNAGPKRVRYWKRINKDPQKKQTNYVDWIELIKFRVNNSHKYRAVLGAEMYTLEQAKEAGLMDEVVIAKDLMNVAMEKAKDLASMGHPSYTLTKELFIAEPMSKINEAMKEYEKNS